MKARSQNLVFKRWLPVQEVCLFVCLLLNGTSALADRRPERDEDAAMSSIISAT